MKCKMSVDWLCVSVMHHFAACAKAKAATRWPIFPPWWQTELSEQIRRKDVSFINSMESTQFGKCSNHNKKKHYMQIRILSSKTLSWHFNVFLIMFWFIKHQLIASIFHFFKFVQWKLFICHLKTHAYMRHLKMLLGHFDLSEMKHDISISVSIHMSSSHGLYSKPCQGVSSLLFMKIFRLPLNGNLSRT